MKALGLVVSDKKIFKNCILKTYFLTLWPTYAPNWTIPLPFSLPWTIPLPFIYTTLDNSPPVYLYPRQFPSRSSLPWTMALPFISSLDNCPPVYLFLGHIPSCLSLPWTICLLCPPDISSPVCTLHMCHMCYENKVSINEENIACLTFFIYQLIKFIREIHVWAFPNGKNSILFAILSKLDHHDLFQTMAV